MGTKVEDLIEISREKMKRIEQRRLNEILKQRKIRVTTEAIQESTSSTKDGKGSFFVEDGVRIPIQDVNIQKMPEVVSSAVKADLNKPIVTKRDSIQ
jgi:hypothetical protein